MGAREKKSKKPSGTRAERLLKEVVFFTDRSLGLGVPQALKDAGYCVERHADHFVDDAPDEEWLADVGARGWVVFPPGVPQSEDLAIVSRSSLVMASAGTRR
jgi:hypothetical protein